MLNFMIMTNSSLDSGSPTLPKGQETLPFEGIIEIRDPEINVQEVMRQIRDNMSRRKSLVPSLRSIILSEDRLALRAAHEHLRTHIQCYGDIGEEGPGLKGKIQFFVKRVIRRLIRRHLEQGR